MNALYLIGFVQAMFFLVLIFSKKKIVLKDIVLASYIFILGTNLLFIYWDQTGFHDKYPLIIILDLAYWTLLGPLLYLYIDIVTFNKPKLQFKYLIHLLPLVFVMIAFSGYFQNYESKSFFTYYENKLLFKLGYIVWMYNSPLYYIILIFKLSKHKKRIKSYYASPKDVDLIWLRYLVHGFAVFLFFLLARGYILEYFKWESFINSYHFNWLVMVIYIFGIGYFGNKQRGIFIEPEIMIQHQEANTTNIKEDLKYSLRVRPSRKNQYLKSGLTDDEAIHIQKKLVDYMENEKPYLDYDLTLPKLASILDTTPHKLSQVINEKYNSNFFEFVNKYRVKDVKKLLKDPSKSDVKVMALAYDCGFNSKSAFYTVFKKDTSLTPSEYRNRQLSGISA